MSVLRGFKQTRVNMPPGWVAFAPSHEYGDTALLPWAEYEEMREVCEAIGPLLKIAEPEMSVTVLMSDEHIRVLQALDHLREARDGRA